MERKVKLEAIYSYVSEFKDVDYSGYKTSGENAEKTVFFNSIEDLIGFCIKNKLEMSFIGGHLLVISDTENPEDSSILGRVSNAD